MLLGQNHTKFYNHLILSGTKIRGQRNHKGHMFYNHLILSGTKIMGGWFMDVRLFYNHLILSGTKISKILGLYMD